jgi:hypothetical protein
MKNEVKKKMHDMRHASLHQSHPEARAKKKILISIRQNTSRRDDRYQERGSIDS